MFQESFFFFWSWNDLFSADNFSWQKYRMYFLCRHPVIIQFCHSVAEFFFNGPNISHDPIYLNGNNEEKSYWALYLAGRSTDFEGRYEKAWSEPCVLTVPGHELFQLSCTHSSWLLTRELSLTPRSHASDRGDFTPTPNPKGPNGH